MDKQATVVVIGAGLSGLSAGKLLHEAGVDVIVLEARDRVGGRTHTIQNEHVGYVDLGGSYFGPTQDHVLRLVDEFGLKLYHVYDKQDYGRFFQNKLERFRGFFPTSWNPIMKIDFDNYLRTMDEYGSTIPLDAPWNAPNAEAWDKMTMKDFHDKIIWTKYVRTFADLFVKLIVTSEPYECSMLWFLWYVAQCGGTQRIFSVKSGGQERKLMGGSQQISIRMAELLEDRVHLNEPVVRVEQTDNGATLHTNSGTYKCDYVVFGIPPAMQAKLQYEPALPASRNQMLQRYPMGSVIKVHAYYRRPFWREKGMSGQMTIEDEGTSVGYTLDDTKPDGSKPALIGFILADRARHFSNVSPEERKQVVAHWLAKVFQSDEALEPIHYEEKNWCAEQWSGGCYTGTMGPGFMTQFGRELRKPLGRYHFAGTECATWWSGYMNGAVQAGERAAREVLNRLGKLSEDQIDVKPPVSKVTLESKL